MTALAVAEDEVMKQKKILMAALNSSWSHTNPAFYYLREMLRDLPYEVRIKNWTTQDQLLDILAEIIDCQAEVICFSAYIWNRHILQQLIPELKKLVTARIVVGGAEAENLISVIDQNDYLVLGAGEGKFRALAESDFHLSPSELDKVKDIPLSQLPFPYHQTDMLDLQGKLVYYELQRGCPFGCIYCLSANDRRNELRFDPEDQAEVQRLYAELDQLNALQPKTLKLVDRSFNTNKKLAHLVWNYLIDKGFSCDVHFEIYPDLLDENDIEILSKMPNGLLRFEIGIQTIHGEIAQASGRNSNWEQARKMLQMLKQRTQVRIHADLLAGLPGEDFSSVLSSLNELCACLPDAVQLGRLKVLPGTPMREVAFLKGYKWLSEPPYTVLQSDALSFAELTTLEEFARLLNLYWNKEEYPDQWKTLLARYSAVEMLEALREIHSQHGYELHSLAKAKRAAVMAELIEKYGA